MKKALYIFGNLFLATNLIVCGYTIVKVDQESAYMDYVQSVYVPGMVATAYLRGCLDMGGDKSLCHFGAGEVKKETQEMLKLED